MKLILFIQKQHQSSINRVRTRTFLRADIVSDYELMMIIRLKVVKVQKKRQSTGISFDLEKLKVPKILEDFQIKIEEKFVPLLENLDIQEPAKNFGTTIADTSNEVLGKKKIQQDNHG